MVFYASVISFLFFNWLPNGLRYPLVGGMRPRRFDGTHSKPRKCLENAQTPTSRVHAVLGNVWVQSAFMHLLKAFLLDDSSHSPVFLGTANILFRHSCSFGLK